MQLLSFLNQSAAPTSAPEISSIPTHFPKTKERKKENGQTDLLPSQKLLEVSAGKALCYQSVLFCQSLVALTWTSPSKGMHSWWRVNRKDLSPVLDSWAVQDNLHFFASECCLWNWPHDMLNIFHVWFLITYWINSSFVYCSVCLKWLLECNSLIAVLFPLRSLF